MTELKQNLENIQRKAIERTVKTQTIEYDLETMVKKIDKHVIKLNPDYQRRHRWSPEFSSRLIESLILNIPVPFIYISQDVDVDEEVENDISRYSVIDGQQRLTAIYEFFKNKYALDGLDVLRELNGSFYKDLPSFLIRRLEERTIRCLRIDSTLDGQVKYDIFERLNSGSVKLEAQELRNAVCRGPFKDLIKKLAKSDDFVALANLDPEGKRVEKMEDEELVVRYFALSFENGYQSYKGGFKKFLTEKMEYFNTLSLAKLVEMEQNFLETFAYISKSSIENPFSKYKVDDDGQLARMSKFNAAVYDSIIVPLSQSDKEGIFDIDAFRELFKDKEYFSAVEGSVNDVSKLNTRISKGLEAIR
ncbi:DUF262 domain-containing protein [Hydrogenovibrio sp. JE_KL2]|uniref:DUF262 domain-containing protein n=1 Tax=Hydrogenovibrio sp. JE_KL2 TaxID=2651188 RepID=UPI00128CFE91|nr:DUF262 domain-containing protein [Hydrogenovibrio sp. JE_KL2]MPQ76166.1 DUF262 domain-containing protein [Hydrogenovibrio sp. JE_KL2]